MRPSRILNFAWRGLATVAITLYSLAGFALVFPDFDRGPDPSDPMQRELVQIIKDMPYVPGISTQLQVLAPSYKRGQKMRPDFGAMPMRGFMIPNSISVLVIGQDGTHIAEGANRPGIAGFGGRVHDMLRHLGIVEGVVFTNLYVNTISGQYGSRNTPVLIKGEKIGYTNVIENRQWLMTHEGPYGKWRNRFISWVIRNNTKSLKLVMMLGQAGKDAGSNFINSIGGKVGPRDILYFDDYKLPLGDGSDFNVPVFEMVGAGGNNEWAVPITAEGKDVAEILRKRDAIQTEVLSELNAEKKKLEEEIARLEEEKASELAKIEGDSKDAAKIERSFEKKIESLEEKVDIARKRINVMKKGLDYRDGLRDGTGISTYLAQKILKGWPKEAKELMVFTNGGPKRNGILYPQQLGGWDLRTMTVNNKVTRSIKDLKIPCTETPKVGTCAGKDYIIAPDIVFTGSPHPTALSMMQNPKKAAVSVTRELIKPLEEARAAGWEPPQPEPGLTSAFLEGKPYHYGRGLIPQSHGDPGITDLRLLPVSTAKRAGSSMIIIGTRNGVNFNDDLVKKLEKDEPSDIALTKSNLVLTGRPQNDAWLYEYDRGPNDKYSKLLFSGMDKREVLWVKNSYEKEAKDRYDYVYRKEKAKGEAEEDAIQEAYEAAVNSVYDKHGIDAFNAKTHPNAGFFGHYRGTFDKPKIIVLADPMGYDSFITSKAATGARGQYINGLMRDLGVEDQYLVISTVPVGMDGATQEEWQAILKDTADYRTNLINELKSDNPEALFMSDGENATAELQRILKDGRKFVYIKQQADDPKAGVQGAGLYIAKSKLIDGVEWDDITGERVDIPRSHLTWIARVWEGTSGDRVITSDDILDRKGKVREYLRGKAFAIVAPNWARRNKVHFTERTREGILEMRRLLANNGEIEPGESLKSFIARRNQCSSVIEIDSARKKKKKDAKPLCDIATPVVFPSSKAN